MFLFRVENWIGLDYYLREYEQIIILLSGAPD